MVESVAGTEAGAMRAVMEALHGVDIKILHDPADPTARVPVAVLPAGMQMLSVKKLIDEFRETPRRRVGTAKMTDIVGFVEQVVAFKADHSVVFADSNPKTPSLLAVLDYHEPGGNEREGTHFGTHRVSYSFPLSEPWQAWAAIDGKSLSMADFAIFLEDRIGDVLVPPEPTPPGAEPDALEKLLRLLGGTLAGPSRLLELSRGLKVHEDSRVTNAVNLSTGELQMSFETEHKDAGGAPLRVPNMFLIGIPVFENGDLYRIPVRLRYRVSGGKVVWILQRYRPEKTFLDAFREACAFVQQHTGLPLRLGAPEA